ncbi:hydrogen peroxide-inducible genes activator [uncultured Psychrosphaera sp.]|uniref:hydrogen peroxide-inducible genes activator n=1 Tax=uncultured Psychrosphaera sp. TaxID=1403522 RepID=UPI002628FD35|nr:hydrogen peroxide-inducible genes activator [uncultured Psychrosphaera sp.]
MKLPKLQQLKYLVALFDTGHFGHAAKKCFVSQSTLSSAIQALEEQLDSQLIERDHKTFVFTPLGVDVVNKARIILEQSADLVATSSAQGNEFSGELQIGIIPTIAPFVMSPLIKKCAKEHPNLELFLREDTTENCLALLREGRLDLVLMATPYETNEFVELSLCKDPFVRVFHPNKLSDNIYLLEKEHCLSDHTIKGCRLTDDANIHPFQASSLNTLLAMVEGHLGETYLPQLAIKSGILTNSSLSSESMPETTASRTLSLVWRKTSHRRVFFAQIGDSIKQVLEEILNK